MYSLSSPKCRSTTDVQQQPQHQYQIALQALPPPPPPSSISSHLNGDYYSTSNCQHEPNTNTSNNRLTINLHQIKTTTPSLGHSMPNNSYKQFEFDHGHKKMCLCNDNSIARYPKHLFNRRSLTLTRKTNPISTIANYDPSLRQYTKKLNKLQTFTSTPDLTSNNVNIDANHHTQNMTNQILFLPIPPPPPPPVHSALSITNVNDLSRPDVIQMHTFHPNDKRKHSITGTATTTNPSKIFQCFHHHHKHNQVNQKLLNCKQSDQIDADKSNETTAPNTTSSFFGDNCCVVSCKKVTIVTGNNDENDEQNNKDFQISTPSTVTSTRF